MPFYRMSTRAIDQQYHTVFMQNSHADALRYFIQIDPMNWILNGDAIRANIKYYYDNLKCTKAVLAANGPEINTGSDLFGMSFSAF